MQKAVIELVGLGALPKSSDADPVTLRRFQDLLADVEQPVSDDEARALVRLFGCDDCFGLAWSLLHCIETAPNWPLEDCLRDSENEWIERLKRRAGLTSS